MGQEKPANSAKETAVVATRTTPAEQLRALLVSRRDALVSVLPREAPVDRFIQTAVSTVARTPSLQKCTVVSLAQSIMVAAEYGLTAGGPTGELYLVQYKNVCTPIIGYRGMIKLALRGGQVSSIEARVVMNGDEFEVEHGLTPKLTHRPAMSDKVGDMRAVYAIARRGNAVIAYEVMSKADVDAIRKRSRASEDGPWVTDYQEMAKKTVVRRMAKYLHLSPLAEAAIATDAVREAQEAEEPDVVSVRDAQEIVADAVAVTEAQLEYDGDPSLEG